MVRFVQQERSFHMNTYEHMRVLEQERKSLANYMSDGKHLRTYVLKMKHILCKYTSSTGARGSAVG
jgi:hypothetical protein